MCRGVDGHQTVAFPRGEMTMVLTKERAMKTLRMVRCKEGFYTEPIGCSGNTYHKHRVIPLHTH